jgi:microtubule-associated protein-like 5
MGNIVERVVKGRLQLPDAFINCKADAVSIGRLREFHQAFKNTGASFAIDSYEFAAIFRHDHAFSVWDTDQNGLVDALEVFSCLALFAEARFDDRIRCKGHSVIFSLFDFNSEDALARNELELMLVVTLRSLCKAMSVVDADDHRSIRDRVLHAFNVNLKLTFREVYDFLQSCEETTQLFEFLQESVKGYLIGK